MSQKITSASSDFEPGYILLKHITGKTINPIHIQMPGPYGKDELDILDLFKFCSMLRTWENFLFFKMKTGKTKMRVKHTCRIAGHEAYSR
jgi:hypothetical protein